MACFQTEGVHSLGCTIQEQQVVVTGCFIYFQQEKEAEDFYPKLWLPEGRLSHCLYTLVNYMFISFFFAVFAILIQLSFCQAYPILFIAGLQNVVLHVNI